MIPEGLSPQQEKVVLVRRSVLFNLVPQAYLLQLKIEEASWRLRSGDLGIPPNPEDRFTSEISSDILHIFVQLDSLIFLS